MSRFTMFCAGLFLACSLSGCCLSHGYGGYPGGQYGGACNNGCGAGAYAPNGYPSAGLMAPGMPQMAYGSAPINAGYAPGYTPQMAAVQFDPLSTR